MQSALLTCYSFAKNYKKE